MNRDNETPKLKIEQDTNINFDSTVKINKKKRVSFNIDGGGSNKNNNLTNFLSKLKQKPIVKDDDIMNKLDIIISNQSEILKLLKSK